MCFLKKDLSPPLLIPFPVPIASLPLLKAKKIQLQLSCSSMIKESYVPGKDLSLGFSDCPEIRKAPVHGMVECIFNVNDPNNFTSVYLSKCTYYIISTKIKLQLHWGILMTYRCKQD